MSQAEEKKGSGNPEERQSNPSFLARLREQPLKDQLKPAQVTSTEDYYNLHFPGNESAKPATDPWSAEEMSFPPATRPSLCHPPYNEPLLTEAGLKAAGFTSLRQYYKFHFPEPKSIPTDDEPCPPAKRPCLFSKFERPPSTPPNPGVASNKSESPSTTGCLPATDSDSAATDSAAICGTTDVVTDVVANVLADTSDSDDPDDDAAFEAMVREAATDGTNPFDVNVPANTLDWLLQYSEGLFVVRPLETKLQSARERRESDHAGSYARTLDARCRPALFEFDDEEELARSEVQFFRACQTELSKKRLADFASWFSSAWGTERFHRAGHQASKAPKSVTHEVDRVWSILGDADDRLVIVQCFVDSGAFFPLAYFPSGDHATFVDFLVSMQTVWWPIRFRECRGPPENLARYFPERFAGLLV